MTSLRIACYYPWVYLRSGIERTILETIKRSGHQWTVYTNHYSPTGTYPDFSGINVVQLKAVSVKRGFLPVARAALTILLQTIPNDQYDVLFVHSEGLGDLITFCNHEKPVVCFCHTPLKIVSDSSARRTYLTRQPGKSALLAISGRIFQSIDQQAWKHYSSILANSETVRDRIVSAHLAGREKVEILNPGVDCKALAPSERYDKFFLAFTRIKWWKNVELAIDGFREFRRDNPDYELIIAGQVDRGSESYFQSLKERASTCDGIRFVRDPSGKEVDELYRSCCAVLNTTLNEDWGMVILEANAYCKPVIAVNRGGPCESQVHGRTGFLVAPDAMAFADAMSLLARDSDLAKEMGEAARRNVLKYDWTAFVSTLDQHLERIAGEKAHRSPDLPRILLAPQIGK